MIPNMNQVAVATAGLAVERLQLMDEVLKLKLKVSDLEVKLQAADVEVTRLKEACQCPT